jgi:hypothetical protein
MTGGGGGRQMLPPTQQQQQQHQHCEFVLVRPAGTIYRDLWLPPHNSQTNVC